MSRSPKPPAPPEGTRDGGRRLWSSVLAEFELDEHELALLREAVRTVDLLDDLAAAVGRDGPLVESPQGVKAHPAAVEARQQRIALARLLAALRLPSRRGRRRPAVAAGRGPRCVRRRVVKRRLPELPGDEQPPDRLLTYQREGYQDPSRVWTTAGLRAWLVERAAWLAAGRDLPGLRARERQALGQLPELAQLTAADMAATRPGRRSAASATSREETQ